MTVDPLYAMAFVTGFLGSGHCLGMCGGIVTALSLTGSGQRGGVPFHLLYNLGRLLTYGLIGLIVGWLGSLMAYTASFEEVSRWLLVFSDFLIIAIGLGTAGAFRRFNIMRLEFATPLQALTEGVRRLRRLPGNLAALPLGLIFGFLPCGFLYAMAIAAAQTARPGSGALVMISFGFGTVPALFIFGSVAHWLSRRARGWMLRGAGVMVALIGLLNLFRHLGMMGILPGGGGAGCFC
ncbi:MAG: sulfite exporter TauE/SafE family protein [Desulfurivibrionaceae bacterium]|nr:sulfite exporter TauE/SafE family protein [Desulfurivibrionaceae bacterium]